MLHKFQYSGGRKVDLAYPPPPLTANRKQSWELENDHEPKWELELLSFGYKSVPRNMKHSASVPWNMKHSASVPWNMTSMIPERRNVLTKEERNLSGFCMIKAHPLATKQMHVHFKASKDMLKIRFSQTHDGSIEYFELCDLSLKDLVVGWIWGDSNLFVIAAELEGKKYNSIYCYPTDNLRNSWLLFFRSNGVRTAPFSAFEDQEKSFYMGSVRE